MLEVLSSSLFQNIGQDRVKQLTIKIKVVIIAMKVSENTEKKDFW